MLRHLPRPTMPTPITTRIIRRIGIRRFPSGSALASVSAAGTGGSRRQTHSIHANAPPRPTMKSPSLLLPVFALLLPLGAFADDSLVTPALVPAAIAPFSPTSDPAV